MLRCTTTSTACFLICVASLTPLSAAASEPSSRANYQHLRQLYAPLAQARLDDCERILIALPRLRWTGPPDEALVERIGHVFWVMLRLTTDYLVDDPEEARPSSLAEPPSCGELPGIRDAVQTDPLSRRSDG